MPNFDDVVARGMAGSRISRPVPSCGDRLDPPAPKAPAEPVLWSVYDQATAQTLNLAPVDARELVDSEPDRYSLIFE